MCNDCPTPRARVRAVLREVGASLVLPVVLYALPIGAVLLLARDSL